MLAENNLTFKNVYFLSVCYFCIHILYCKVQCRQTDVIASKLKNLFILHQKCEVCRTKKKKKRLFQSIVIDLKTNKQTTKKQ